MILRKLAALSVAIAVPASAAEQAAPNDLASVYRAYLQAIPWGNKHPATTFKTVSLGQQVQIGKGTDFPLCKGTRDANGELDCWGAPPIKCPPQSLPKYLRCTFWPMTTISAPALIDPLRTAFGARVKTELIILPEQILLPSWNGRSGARIVQIQITNEESSDAYVEAVKSHLNDTALSKPIVTTDDTVRAKVNRACKEETNRLYAKARPSQREIETALQKCESRRLEDFLRASTGTTWYQWKITGAEPKMATLAVIRSLAQSRAIITMEYPIGQLTRSTFATMNAMIARQQNDAKAKDF